MDRLIDRTCRGLEILIVAALAIMVVMVFGNVVLRYAFNSGITASEELSRWLFVWMTFIGAVIAIRERGHLGTDALVARLPRAGRLACYGVSHVLMLFVCGLVFKGAWEQTRINWTTTSAVTEWSMAIFYASGLTFAVLGGVVLAFNLWRLASGRVGDDELVGMNESEEQK
ncbi:MAG: TRAP transporter small permease [Burkholderiales bacterium]|nr:TRAP transporter small permease [Burkholderiales bacterium]